MNIDFTAGRWIHTPQHYQVTKDYVEMVTEPATDFWQRSYYGFRNDNAPALQIEYDENFTFLTEASFTYRQQFDQCGVIIYIDRDNWFKASVEYENERFSRLGSVVTNHGYSDWATTDIATSTSRWYRLSRRGPDFLIESSDSANDFRQMRIFHLHCLGETTADMGRNDPAAPARQSIRFGLYACSPSQSSFTARFSHFTLDACLWKAHGSA
ncbi:MAG: DUF1349 domain-containing protein [Proteobacteria bacterium]|nr:DUF1349 domain-containing protein [Pseudomonadota bacterium]